MAVKLELPRCKAVLDYWDKDLKAIFASYAAADMDVDAQVLLPPSLPHPAPPAHPPPSSSSLRLTLLLHACLRARSHRLSLSACPQDATDSINLAELMFMMNEGKLIDPNLTVSAVSKIFTHVNTQSEEEEGGDEDESELDYYEFKQVLVPPPFSPSFLHSSLPLTLHLHACVRACSYRVPQVVVRLCDAKIPEDKRGGEPFENTLQAWLQLVFVPTFRRILKDKARGIGSKTL